MVLVYISLVKEELMMLVHYLIAQDQQLPLRASQLLLKFVNVLL